MLEFNAMALGVAAVGWSLCFRNVHARCRKGVCVKRGELGIEELEASLF